MTAESPTEIDVTCLPDDEDNIRGVGPQAVMEQVGTRTDASESVRRLTVVVADDDAAVRHLMSRVLTRAGFRVLEAPDGREALRLAQAEAADLVITDLVMPEQDNIETIGMLAKLEPRPAIIAISGAFGGTMLRAASALGAATALQKPFSANELLRAVGSALASAP